MEETSLSWMATVYAEPEVPLSDIKFPSASSTTAKYLDSGSSTSREISKGVLVTERIPLPSESIAVVSFCNGVGGIFLNIDRKIPVPF